MNQPKPKCNLDEIFPKKNGAISQNSKKLRMAAQGLNNDVLAAQIRLHSAENFSELRKTIDSFEAMSNSIKRVLQPISMPALEISKQLEAYNNLFKSFEAPIRQYQESIKAISNAFSRLQLPDLTGINAIINSTKGFESALNSALFKDLNQANTILDSLNTGINFDLEIPAFKTLEIIEKIALSNLENKTQAYPAFQTIEEIKEIVLEIRNEQNKSQRREDIKWTISLLVAIILAIFSLQPGSVKKQELQALFSLQNLVKFEIKKLNEIQKLIELCETKTKTVVKTSPNSGATTRVKLDAATSIKALKLHGKWCQIEFHYKNQEHSGWCQKKCLNRRETLQ